MPELSEMSGDVRCAVAFVAWRLITGRESQGIYDHANERRKTFSGMITDTRIDLKDEVGRPISGSGGSGMYTLAAGAAAKPVTLKISGLDFEGFDYGTSRRYRGTVDRHRLSISEGQAPKSFDFSVSEG